MVSNVKKVSKGSKFVINVQGIKKGKNSAKGQSRRRVDISTSFSGRVTEKWDGKLKICPNTIHSYAYNYHCTKFHEKMRTFFCRREWVNTCTTDILKTYDD